MVSELNFRQPLKGGCLMGLGRPIPELSLTESERQTLERWTRRPTTAQVLARRAQIVLACAEGKTNTAVAAELRLAKPTVGKGRGRFVERRVGGLLGETRPGAPREDSD